MKNILCYCFLLASTISFSQNSLTYSVSVTNISCFGGADGTATVNISSGDPPYSYLWSTAETTSSISSPAGNYTVTVMDLDESVTGTFTITQPNSMSYTVSTTPDTSGGSCDGTATVFMSGGVTPYTYQWLTTPLQTTSTVSDLCVGNYTVIIIDANGCNIGYNVTVTSYSGISEYQNMVGYINVYPNPTNSSTRIDYTFPNGVNEGEIIFYDLQGKELKRFKVDKTFDHLLISTADIAAGTYFFQLQTSNQTSEGKKMVVIK